MALDQFSLVTDSLIAPARRCFDIVPDDNVALSEVVKAVYVGTGGDLCVRAVDSTDFVTFRNVPNGMLLDVRVIAVRAAGTSAADLVGLA